MTRETWQKWLESLGAEVLNNVNKRTTVLLVGEEPGAVKIEKAKKLGIPLLNFAIFTYLGLADKRSGAEKLYIDENIISETSIQMAIFTEELYGKAIKGDRDAERGLRFAQRAIDKLLRAAWGDVVESVPVGDG